MSTTMFRTTAVRGIPRSFATLQAPKPRMSLYNTVQKASLRTSARPAKATRVLSLTVARPFHTSLVRYESKGALEAARLDIKKAEENMSKQTLKPVPEAVSLSSTTRSAGELTADHEDDVDMMAGIRSDFVGFPEQE